MTKEKARKTPTGIDIQVPTTVDMDVYFDTPESPQVFFGESKLVRVKDLKKLSRYWYTCDQKPGSKTLIGTEMVIIPKGYRKVIYMRAPKNFVMPERIEDSMCEP